MLKENNQGNLSFTIIIPTRDRVDTLIHTINTARAIDYSNYFILVSDNASKDDTKNIVSSINDDKLHYINTGRRVSMTENWEFALDNVSTDWVTVLGDDDGILPNALTRVNEIVQQTGVSAVRSNGCSFTWPELTSSDKGLLRVSLNNGYEVFNSLSMLQRVLDGYQNYNMLPMLYNGGFVSTEVLKKAKEISGNIFRSSIPDVYSAVVISLLTNSYAYSHEPLAINGASSHSNGTAAYERNKRIRNYDPSEKFWSENTIPLHDDIPTIRKNQLVRSLQAGVYESFLQASIFDEHKNIRITHQNQIEVIIGVSGSHPVEIREWAREFCIKHRLAYPGYFRILFIKTKLNLVKLLNRYRIGIYYYIIRGNQSVRLKNVYDASIVTSVIKLLKPSLFKRLLSRYSFF